MCKDIQNQCKARISETQDNAEVINERMGGEGRVYKVCTLSRGVAGRPKEPWEVSS